MRVASIDIGSYSVRLKIFEVESYFKSVYEEGHITALAKGLKETGFLSEEGVNETLKVLKGYKKTIDYYKVEKVIAVGTEALRRARNREYFIKKVRKETGIEVKVITPEEEGRYSYLSAVYSLNLKGNILVVDQGGGSTEFIYGEDFEMKGITSLDMGIVTLTESFIKSDPPLREELESMKEYILDRLRLVSISIPADKIVGLGGTITTLAALENNIYPYDPSKVHGKILHLDSIRKWFDRLTKLRVEERKKIPAVEDKRAEAIVSGILMFICIMEYFSFNAIMVSDWGLKEGIIIEEFLLNEKKRGGG